MGYESKVCIVEVTRRDGIYAEPIAIVNMCVMESSFKELFKKEIDYDLPIDGKAGLTHEDKYQEHMRSCSVNEVVRYLEEQMRGCNYRRLSVLLGLLRGFDQREWESLEVVHYGY